MRHALGRLEYPVCPFFVVTTVGLDLAKSLFQMHRVNGRGHVVRREQLWRVQVVLSHRNGSLLQRRPLGAQAAGPGTDTRFG